MIDTPRVSETIQHTEASRLPLQSHPQYLTRSKVGVPDAGNSGGKTSSHVVTRDQRHSQSQALLKGRHNQDATALHHIAMQSNQPTNTAISENEEKIYKEKRENVVNMPLHNHTKIEAGNINRWTPLMFAAYDDEKVDIGLLLTQGGRRTHIDATDSRGFTALMLAASQGHVAMVQALLAAGADVECKSEMGFRPLMLSAEKGHVPVAKILLRKKAALEATNSFQSTALHLAVLGGNIDMVLLLLSNGANREARDSKGETAITLAFAWPHVAKLLKTYKPGQSQETRALGIARNYSRLLR